MLWFLALAVILVGLDQWVKAWIASHVLYGTTQVVLPGILSLTHIHNDGAAWSMLAGQQWLFTVVSVIALAVLIWFFFKTRCQWAYSLGLTLMIAGTLGNFIDRLHQGFVVDMFQLDFINFPIFNVADMCLTVGVIWLLIVIFRDGDRG
ncbi:lipoprotein signal peptidase [Secundilactobacillus kimchicus JCM 15530]|uniref:Lipoprotein signal peptidase n=1 Tax=Secundilactobacillus kimchicus JCM 15530 TaxID=1302272 RepID=A0A0R1I0S1_9LACO|nr:signal peptidase II [Secundilactobacillus kimchicus]KRK49338.1 lipoprotein signal peptidase [Secundilactobacillus kimchicus JCM 15530]